MPIQSAECWYHTTAPQWIPTPSIALFGWAMTEVQSWNFISRHDASPQQGLKFPACWWRQEFQPGLGIQQKFKHRRWNHVLSPPLGTIPKAKWREQVLPDTSLSPFLFCQFWWFSALSWIHLTSQCQRWVLKVTWGKENNVLGGQQGRAAQQKPQCLNFQEAAVNNFTERKLYYKGTERWDKFCNLVEKA